jgi:hypothetical protein
MAWRGEVAALLGAVVVVAIGACSAADSPAGPGAAGKGGAAASSGAGGGGGIGAVGATGGALIEGGTGECDDSVDVVFVMDVSTSMGPFLDKLAQEVLVVDQAVKQLEPNAPPRYGLVVFVDDVTFVNSGQPYTDILQLQQDFKYWSNFTSSNKQTSGTGSNSTWPENSLDALYVAAQDFPWRPSAQTLRMIIHTTDDTFWNGPTFQDGVQIQHSYVATLAKLQEQKVRVFSFAAELGGPLGWDDVKPGWFTGYQGMPPIPSAGATGGNAWDINKVMQGTISLSDAINTAIEESRCEPYPTPT